MAHALTPATQEAAHSQPTSHPLRPVFVTVLAAKVVVAAFLLATVSMAPPVSAEASYLAALD